MNDDGGVRPPNHPGTQGSGGVRAPLPGESSSANIPAPSTNTPLDSPTVLNIPVTEIFSSTSLPRPASRPPDREAPPGADLANGDIIGNRYEIISMLGVGGMGAVYKAKDLEIGRLVALKVIRPEFARDRAIIDRFKQELLLASQVTHKNVIRIFDLGDADGLKFITMEYIDGRDLHAILRERGCFPPEEVIAIIRQVCRALQAAHTVGVVHRDLKPQNILLDSSGRALVMDFGLARTLEDNGMTQSGSLVGTMEYMSPEQALGKPVDQRSDIFALGIIFYELLAGSTPFQAQSAVASLILRTQQSVEPLSNINPAIPKPLCEVVCKCLERDVVQRYQTVGQILIDLDVCAGDAPATAFSAVTQIHSSLRIPAAPIAQRKTILGQPAWKVFSLAATLLLVLTFGLAYRTGLFSRVANAVGGQSGPRLSLAVFPLRNASGDTSIDWMSSSLADMLTTAVGQSAQLRTVSPERLRQVYSDLRLTPDSTLDSAMVKRIAGFTTADTIVSGQYVRLGDQIDIQVDLQDLKNERTTTLKASATQQTLPTAIATLADSIRKNLSLSSADVKALQAQSFQPTSTSAAALRDYNQAVVLAGKGRNLDANQLLTNVVQQDPKFALAYALLGQVQSELGYQAEAEQSSRRALELAENQSLPPVVQDLIHANHARIIQSNDKAIEAYQRLARNLPGNTDVQYTLASLYVETGVYDKARTIITSLLKEDPKNVRALWQMGVIEITSNNPQTALDPLGQALTITIQTDNQEMKALTLLATGICYRLLNKPDDALRNYQESIAINQKLGHKRGMAAALDEMALVQASAGNSDAALASYQKALALLREIGMTKEVGDTLMDMGGLLSDRGQSDQALQAYQEALKTQRASGDENFEALCLNNIADVYVSRGDTGSAFTYYQQALQLREKLGVPGYLAQTLLGMGQAYAKDGQYDDAVKSLIRGLDLARKADDPRTAALISHQMGMVFANEGRFGAAITSIQDSLKGLHTLGEKSVSLAEAQNDLAEALARAGRNAEASTALDGADAIAHDFSNEILMAKLLNTRGDIALYQGNSQTATQNFRKALQLVQHRNEASTTALTQLNLARVALAEAHPREALTSLSPLVNKRTTFDQNLSIRISSAYAEALIATKTLSPARQSLLTDLGDAEKSGMKPEIGRINYLLSLIATATNNSAEAANYSRQAIRILDSIRSEPGSESILQRADLKAIYQACNDTIAAVAAKP